MTDLVLHGYWRSGTSYRTRIALNLKGLRYRQEPVNLLHGDQGAPAYRTLNPQALVPVLVADCHIVPQVYSAERFNVALDAYPALMRAAANARNHEAVAMAHPDKQPDAAGA